MKTENKYLEEDLEVSRISEAYSMQPIEHYVGECLDEGVIVKSITLETNLPLSNNIRSRDFFYVGRCKNDKILFIYRADAVNVEYKVKSE